MVTNRNFNYLEPSFCFSIHIRISPLFITLWQMFPFCCSLNINTLHMLHGICLCQFFVLSCVALSLLSGQYLFVVPKCWMFKHSHKHTNKSKFTSKLFIAHSAKAILIPCFIANFDHTWLTIYTFLMAFSKRC